jgi:uncharacterized membrane protein
MINGVFSNEVIWKIISLAPKTQPKKQQKSNKCLRINSEGQKKRDIEIQLVIANTSLVCLG